MLVAMFRYAGLVSYPVVSSTKDYGVPLFPTIDGLNYVLAAVKDAETYNLFDATEMFSTTNVLPERALNWEGTIIAPTGSFTRIDLFPKTHSNKLVYMDVIINNDNSVSGKAIERFNNQYSLGLRKNHISTGEESYILQLEKYYGHIEITNFEFKDNKDLSKQLIQSFDWYKEEAISEFANSLHISPFLHLAISENPFKSDTRNYPVEFAFPWLDTYMINIKIPSGYKIVSIPESLTLSLPNGLGSFKYAIKIENSSIKLDSFISINSPVIKPELYPQLKKFYQEVLEKQTELVVLKKI
jgi:hypothetical protein